MAWRSLSGAQPGVLQEQHRLYTLHGDPSQPLITVDSRAEAPAAMCLHKACLAVPIRRGAPCSVLCWRQGGRPGGGVGGTVCGLGSRRPPDRGPAGRGHRGLLVSSKCQEQLSSLPCLLPLGPHPMVASPCPLATACLLPHYPYIVTLSPTYRFLPEPQYTLTTLYKLPCAASTSSRVTLALCPSLPTLASLVSWP